MKTIIDLMKYDKILLMGTKRSHKIFMIGLTLFLTLGSLLLPIYAGFAAFIIPIMIASEFSTVEIDHHGELTKAILPVKRSQNGAARSLLVAGVSAAASAVLFIIVLISMKLDFFRSSEILDQLIQRSSKETVVSVIFSGCYALGLGFASRILRNYYRKGVSRKKGATLRNGLKFICAYFGIGALLYLLGTAANFPIIATILMMITEIVSALAQPMHGLLLCLLILLIGGGLMTYRTVCAMIEYEDREL